MKLYTTKIVAQYLDLSERRVRQLRDEGVLEEKAPGLYDLRSSVRRYINYLRGDEGGKADLNEERAKLTKEKRIAAETENKVRNGELYRKSDITVGMTTVVMNLRSRLLALPNKLAANIAKLDGDEGKIIPTRLRPSARMLPPPLPSLAMRWMSRSMFPLLRATL